MHQQPTARSEGIYVERIDEECIVYDREAHMAHSLTEVALRVWESCDGRHSADQLASELGYTPALVSQALTELSDCGLLDDDSHADVPRITRRQAGKRLGIVGGMALAAPLIYSVTVGGATAAASTATCDGLECSGSGGSSDAAQSAANSYCAAQPECRVSSTCNCVPDNSSSEYDCSADGNGDTAVCVY